MDSPIPPSSPGPHLAGSFRDPSGYVFSRQQRIFRAIDKGCGEVVRGLIENGLLWELTRKRMIVSSEFVEDDALRRTLAAEHPGFEHFLEHDVLTTITYPYEWSISMLADAGVLTIDLQLCLLEAGCSLKDATAYNVQFQHARPIFVDFGSFERPGRLDVWFAMGQFSQMFTFPLLLCRHQGWNLHSYFLANLGGRSVEQVARGLGWLQRLRPRLLLDVTLPALLTRWSNRNDRARRELLEKPKTDTLPQVLNLRRLRSKISKLAAGYKPSSAWSRYTQTCKHGEAAEQAKKGLVAAFLQSTKPRRVLDLGCNTGDYSRLAAESGAEVVAVDSDHDAVEILYRQLRKAPAPITPLVVDLCNPSPAIGYLNRERASFLQRVDADCVLALALVHRLLIAGNLSPTAIRDLVFELTRRDLVLEFVPRDDAMFRELMKFRVDLFHQWTLENCREVFLERFFLRQESPIPGSKRTLLFLSKKEVDLPLG